MSKIVRKVTPLVLGLAGCALFSQPSFAVLITASINSDAIVIFDEDTGEFLGPASSGAVARGGEIGVVLGPDDRVYNTSAASGGSRTLVYQWDQNVSNPTVFADSQGFRTDRITPPYDLVFGPDGNIYVGSRSDSYVGSAADIIRFDGTSGAYIDTFSSIPGDQLSYGLEVGPDGALYALTHPFVDPRSPSRIYRLDFLTATASVFVPSGTGGLDQGQDFKFGPDGNIYVTSRDRPNLGNKVLRFDGTTGAFIDVFASFPDDPVGPRGLDFGPDGNLYVAVSNDILKLDALTGTVLGTFVSGLDLSNSVGARGFGRLGFMPIEYAPPPANVIPEPFTLALFTTGLAGLGFVGWWRREKPA